MSKNNKNNDKESLSQKISKMIKNSFDWYGKNQKKFWLFGAIIISIWAAYDTGSFVTKRNSVDDGGLPTYKITTEELKKIVDRDRSGVLIIGQSTKYKDIKGNTALVTDFKSQASEALLDELIEKKMVVNGQIETRLIGAHLAPKDIVINVLMDFLLKATILAVYMFIIYFIFKQVRQSKIGGGIGGKRFRKIEKDSKQLVKISDVAGHQAAKQELVEIIEYLKEPERFERAGANPVGGVLMYGPPGNGKTLLAKAIAGEADANFLEQEASSFVQIYVGTGAMAVNQLFEEARKLRPCVIFIDEIDALGMDRNEMSSGDERAQAVNALLTQMDGFHDNTGIVVVAATNRKEKLDPALLRPGRFDRKVRVGLPNKNDRYEILSVHAKKIPDMRADLQLWASKTEGYSGADLASLVNEAATEAARKRQTYVTDIEFNLARDRITLGPMELNRNISEEDKKVISYHELGHAVVRIKTGGVVEKVSVKTRGGSLGVTVSNSGEIDSVLQTEDIIFNEIKVLMAGRAAEQIFFEKITSGSSDDVVKASQLARDCIRKFSFYDSSNMSKIEEEKAEEMIRKAFEESKIIIQENKDKIKKLATLLIKNEELKGALIEDILNNNEN